MTTPKPIHPAHSHKQRVQAECCQAEDREITSPSPESSPPPPADRKKMLPTYYHREIF
ncbi:MAG: hypothetical protein P8046_05225 [Anaerolineales bacterium]